MNDVDSSRRRMIDLRSGGWVLALALLLVLAVVAWRGPVVWNLATSSGEGGPGDGPNGFDLTHLTVPRETVVPTGSGRNAIPALVDPPVMSVQETVEFNHRYRGNYLVSADRVIGVTLEGISRAYPLRVLNWHEIINDTLAGIPIAVTYHPLCGSVSVFRRDLTPDRMAEFGVSGLLGNSNLLFYDRTEPLGAESLWSQLSGRAISGADAERGARLTLLPVSLARWDHWIERHPETTVVRPAATLRERYRRNPYGNYLRNGSPRFPVDPLPPADDPGWMSPVLAVANDEGFETYLLGDDDLEPGFAAERLAGVEIRAGEPGSGDPPSILVDPLKTPPTVYSLWFAWYAYYPETVPRSF